MRDSPRPYRSIRVSDQTLPDLCRALWVAARLNASEGFQASNDASQQAEAFGRIVREWSEGALPEYLQSARDTVELDALEAADWRCVACGATGLNAGGLAVQGAPRCPRCR